MDATQRFSTRVADYVLAGQAFHWFAPGSCCYLSFDKFQEFDREGLQGRLLSSSYVPSAGHPRFQPMLAELARLFDQYQEHNRVRFEYDTELYLGHL